eukprot:5015713-Pleurochrysis_carterae.AAC.2
MHACMCMSASMCVWVAAAYASACAYRSRSQPGGGCRGRPAGDAVGLSVSSGEADVEAVGCAANSRRRLRRRRAGEAVPRDT